MGESTLPRPLDEVTAGRPFEVHSVYGNAAMLRRILRLGLLEGCRISVTGRDGGGLLCRANGGGDLRLPSSMAHCIWVVPGAPPPHGPARPADHPR